MGNRIYIQTKTLQSGEHRMRVFDDQSDTNWVTLGDPPQNPTPENLLAAGYEQEWEIQDILDIGFLGPSPAYFNDANFNLKEFEQQLQAIKRAKDLNEELPTAQDGDANAPLTPKVRM